MATLFFYLLYGLFISFTDFIKRECVKRAEVLGVNQRTMEDWLEKAIQQTDIERIMKGMFRKKSA